MTELIKNAWLGWLDYTENGKLVALLLIALLLFWFGKREIWNQYSRIFQYTTVVSVLCICPLTAAVLMIYQTRFYDYQWIWTFVPMTLVVALAGTLFWTELWEKYSAQRARWKLIGISVLIVCVIYFCGRLEKDIWDAGGEAQKQEETAAVLEVITENGQKKDVILWAPQGIMEYARALDGSVRLPYGRNMWDPALNAYSYETYGESETILYQWMSHAEQTGEGMVEIVEAETTEAATTSRKVTTQTCMDMALELGVNYILLPGTMQEEVLKEVEDYLGIAAEHVEGYYLFKQ